MKLSFTKYNQETRCAGPQLTVFHEDIVAIEQAAYEYDDWHARIWLRDGTTIVVAESYSLVVELVDHAKKGGVDARMRSGSIPCPAHGCDTKDCVAEHE